MDTKISNFDKAYLEALTTLNQSKIKRYIEKPIEVNAEQIFSVPEDQTRYKESDWQITNANGNQEYCTDEYFCQNYEKCNNGKYMKKNYPVIAWQTEQELNIPYNSQTYCAKPGDYIVRNSEDNISIIAPEIFLQSYDKCED